MVVVNLLILCSKFAKKSPGPAGGPYSALPDPYSWIMGKGGERGDGRAGGGKGRGRERYPFRMKILATVLKYTKTYRLVERQND